MYVLPFLRGVTLVLSATASEPCQMFADRTDIPLPGQVQSVDLEDGVLSVVHSPSQVALFDLQDPTAPVKASTVELDNGSFVALLGNGHLFVFEAFAFKVFDVANPYEPRMVATIPVPYLIQTATHHGDYVFGAVTPLSTVADNSLVAIDISSPHTPRLVSQISAPATWYYLPFDGVLVTYGAGDERWYSVSDEGILAPGGSWPRWLYRLAAVTDTRAVVWAGNVMQVLDLSEPSTPIELSTTPQADIPSVLLTGNGYALAADSESAARITLQSDDTLVILPENGAVSGLDRPPVKAAFEHGVLALNRDQFVALYRQTACGCPQDMDGNGKFEVDDLQAFIAAFVSDDPSADFAADFGSLDANDILAFLDAMATGCL